MTHRCSVCKHSLRFLFNQTVLRKYLVGYYLCSNCQHVQTEKPYWLSEAYKNSINICDTGIIQRNLLFSMYTTALISHLFDKKAYFLDYSGGYGIFTRMMRDVGFDYYWQDRFTENLVARGFEDDGKKKYELITAFEVFEHVPDPAVQISQLFKKTNALFFTTELITNPPQSPDKWWYYGFEHGQHISFYSLETLRYIAQQSKLNLYSDGRGLHLLTRKIINPLKFKLVISTAPYLFTLYERLYESKTLSDHYLLK